MSTPPNENPFQAPGAEIAMTPQQRTDWPSLGLPIWEQQVSFGSFFKTTWQVLFQPGHIFRHMPRSASIIRPVGFLAASSAIFAFFVAIVMSALCIFILTSDVGNEFAPGFGLLFAIGILFYTLIAFFGPLIGCFAVAGCVHVILMMFGSAKHGYEATLRLITYVWGACWPLALVSLVPIIGQLAAIVWPIVVLVIGLSEVQQISRWKATAFVVIPFLIVFAIALSLWLLLIFQAIASQNL